MMYSTLANATGTPDAFSEASGLKCMVSRMPVTIWITSTSIASEPKKYQKLKFFGA
jgi:hypothetical protein